GQYLKIAAGIPEVSDALQRIIDHFEVWIFVHERIDVVVAFAPLAVRSEESPVGAEKVNPEIIKGTVHGLSQVLYNIFPVLAVDEENIKPAVTGVTIGSEIQAAVLRHIGKHFIARGVDLGSKITYPCE